jgi:hypothetical protein
MATEKTETPKTAEQPRPAEPLTPKPTALKGDRYSWKFTTNTGTYHEVRLGAWYASSGLEYNKEKPPHIEPVKSSNGKRQLVAIEAIVNDPHLFNRDAEAKILEHRYADTPDWDYEFVSLEKDEDASKLFHDARIAAEEKAKRAEKVAEAIHPPEEA